MCRIDNKDTSIAIVKNKMGLATACQSNDIVVADFPIDEWDECITQKRLLTGLMFGVRGNDD